MKTLFVFTGGGLAPALNPTLYGVISEARRRGWRILGGLFGWASLLRNGRHIDLTDLNIESLKNNGGTILRSSRANPYATADGISQLRENIKMLGINAIIAIGGDDTLRAAAKLSADNLTVVGIPKTVDNDLPGTYYTPGFPSAAYYLSNFVNEIKRDAAYALSRIYIIEAMGFKAGWLTCAGALGGADLVLPPEWKISWKKVLARLSERYKKNGNFAVVVVSQEARFEEGLSAVPDLQIGDEHGHARQSFICLALRDRIRTDLGIDAKALFPGNYVETGNPIPLDRDMAIALGKKSIELLTEGITGQMCSILPPTHGKNDFVIGTFPLDKLVDQRTRPLDPKMFDSAMLLPTSEFFDYMSPLIVDFPQFKNDDYLLLTHKIITLSREF